MRNACDPRLTHEVDEGETGADGWRDGEKVPFLWLLGKPGKWPSFLTTSKSV